MRPLFGGADDRVGATQCQSFSHQLAELPCPVSAAAPLILASTSKYRAELLSRLQLPFVQIAPDLDETPRPREAPRHLALRLAKAKAEAVAAKHRGRWALGSDQVVDCDGEPLGKPGDRERAIAQLSRLSGREVSFLTAVALANTAAPRTSVLLDLTVVKFRRLRRAEIDRYVDAEPAWDCAGSFKCEGLGISLFSEIRSTDPTGLVGLPLIATRRLLTRAGYAIP